MQWLSYFKRNSHIFFNEENNMTMIITKEESRHDFFFEQTKLEPAERFKYLGTLRTEEL